LARYEKGTKYRRAHGIVWAIPPLGAQRRIQALMALGWTGQDIADAAGFSHRNRVRQILVGQKGKPCRWIERRTDAVIRSVYEELSMLVPPMSAVHARTRTMSRRKGWAVPLAWDDIDDPSEQPKGVRSTTPFDDDRLDRILELDEMHAGIDEVCAALGIGRDALWKWCDKQGRRDLYARISGRTRTMPNQWTGVA
jgi:hypothetical protein